MAGPWWVVAWPAARRVRRRFARGGVSAEGPAARRVRRSGLEETVEKAGAETDKKLDAALAKAPSR